MSFKLIVHKGRYYSFYPTETVNFICFNTLIVIICNFLSVGVEPTVLPSLETLQHKI